MLDEAPPPAAGHGRVVACADFAPAPWLPGPHLPTVWASVCRRAPAVALRFERVELPDGDFLDLAWTAPTGGGPAVLVLHGLEGSHRSPYARAILAALAAAGLTGVLMHFRGCSGEPNRLDRSYHSGDTADCAYVAALIEARCGRPPLAVIGYSVGGNVLLKWLGELGNAARPATAVAVSVPFDLALCAARLEEGFSRVYRRHLVGSLQRKHRRKFAHRPRPAGVGDGLACDTFAAFDDAVTAPLHGFRDAADYYRRASCRPYLAAISIPTLILHAADDPFVPRRAIPAVHELAPTVALELAPTGGHVGFVEGALPGRARYWLERRILAHLTETLRRHGRR